MNIDQLDVVDAHAHFFSHLFYRTLLEQRPGKPPPPDAEVSRAVSELGLDAPPVDPLGLAARWIEDMDRNAVRRVVLIASVPPDWPSVAAAIAAYPDRFRGYTMVDPRRDDAPQIARQAVTDGGLRGLCIFPAMHRLHVHDEHARALIEVAQEHDAIVFCHFGVLKIPIRDRLGLPSPFDGTFANPTDLHRVAADYPDVTFQVPHFGGGYLRETLMLGAQCDNVVVDTSSSNRWTRFIDPALELGTVVRMALDAFGPERILWGSDSGNFPPGWRRERLDEQLEVFGKAGCKDTELQAIFGGNARRLLG